jgi:hypothetical protein
MSKNIRRKFIDGFGLRRRHLLIGMSEGHQKKNTSIVLGSGGDAY